MRSTLPLWIALSLLAGCPKKGPAPAAPPTPAATTPAVTTPAATTRAATPDATTAPVDAAAAPAPKAGQLTDSERAVNDAVALLQKDDPTATAKAADALAAIVKKDPGLAWGWFNLGVAQYQRGNAGDARQDFATAIDRDATLGPAYLYMGLIDSTSDPAGAVRIWRDGIAHDAENMDLRVALIGALRDQGKIDDAIAEAKAALKINSNSLPVYNNLGLIYMEKGQLELAMFVYQKALQSVPDAETNAYVHCNMGRIFFLQGDKGPALFHLKMAVDEDPKFVPALIYLAQIYQDDKNYTDMVPLLETAAKEDPNNHGVFMNLGVAYRGVGRLEDAKAAYEKAIKIDATNPDPYFNLGILYGDYMKTPDGVKMYDPSIEAFHKYIDMGGKDKVVAQQYADDVDKDKKKYLKKQDKLAADAKKKAEDAAQKAADAAAAKKAAEDAAKNPPPPDGGTPAPDGGTPAPDGGTAPASDGAPPGGSP